MNETALRSVDPLDLVLSLLEGWTKQGPRQFQARCPAHDDRSPSLSIGVGLNGKVLLRCHAGCSVEAIVEAIGLEMADLFLERTSYSDSPGPESTYDYTDSAGALLFQVVRFPGKKFRQRQPDGHLGADRAALRCTR